MNRSPRLLHALKLRVRWGDMDALGHVNNAEYLRYFEQSRIEWLEALGYPTMGKGSGPILLKSVVTYLKPIVYPCEIEVRMYPAKLGNTSFTVASEIVNGRDAAERFTQGEFVIVWFDYDARMAVAVPEKLRALLAEVS